MTPALAAIKTRMTIRELYRNGAKQVIAHDHDPNRINVTTDAGALAKVAVTGEVLEHTKGPKIRIHKFKNKTGYHKRQGHRQQLTVLKVTGIK